jgi:hypothetical protein
VSLEIDVPLRVSGKKALKSDNSGHCFCLESLRQGLLRLRHWMRIAANFGQLEKKLPSGWLVPLGILPFRPRYSFVRS